MKNIFMSSNEAARKTLKVPHLTAKDVLSKIQEAIKEKKNKITIYACQISRSTYKALKKKHFDIYIDDEGDYNMMIIRWR